MFIQVMEKFNRFPNTCNNKNNWIQNRQVHTVQLLLAWKIIMYTIKTTWRARMSRDDMLTKWLCKSGLRVISKYLVKRMEKINHVTLENLKQKFNFPD